MLPVQARPSLEIPSSEPCQAIRSEDLTRALDGHPQAQFLVGHTYVAGLCGQDHATVLHGLDWLVRAARNGEPNAAYQLARIYEEGALIEPAPETAFAYYRAAAKAGHLGGERDYGLRLLGRSGSVDELETAFLWLGTAASNGDAVAATAIGFVYANGLHGVPQDPCLALDWYEASDLIGAPFPLDNLRAEALAAMIGQC
ncbi:MAG: tetratricopeptide repeat protein [Pseudomonadota bacterium]